eukprot:Em0006g1240a
MSARKEDALKGLQLLEQYRARLEGTDELALQGTLSNAIAALRSSRFTALLDIHDAYVTSLELSKGVRFTKQTDQGDGRYPLVSPSSNSSSAWNTSAHLTSVFNGSARVHCLESMQKEYNQTYRVGRTEVLVIMSQQVTDADSPIEARDLRDVKVPTTDQTVPEATAGNAMLSMETKTSCEPTIQVTDMNMMERHGNVPDPAPTAGVESNASVETILPAHTNGTIDQEAKRESVEHSMYMPTPLKGATEDVLDEQRCLAELKHASMGEQKTTSSDEQQTEQKCNAQNDPQNTLCNGEQNPPCNEEQNPPCNDEQNPPCNGEQNPPCNGEQNPPCNDEQNPPCNGEQNPPCNGEQNPPCNGEQRSEQGSPPVCVVEQEQDKQRHPGVTEEQGPVCNSEHKSAEGQKHACNGEQMPLSAEEQKALKATAKRFNIAKEFMDTEAKYVDRLKIISDFLGIVRDFDADNKHIIPELTNRLMFGHVQEMYELNSSLLKGLQHCMDVWKTEERLGVILREYAPKLKVYCLYAAGYEDAIKAITNWSARDKKFDILVKEFDERMGEGSGGGFITRCMLEPVLRILRYRLLLTEYIKYGVKGSSELENSEAAQTVISEAASESNSRIEELKNCNEILAIQRSLNVTKSLLVSGRSFIKKGELLKQSRKTSYTRMFFLFSDILLHTDLCIGLGQSFKIKDELSVWGMKVEEPLVPPLPYCFIVTSVKRSLILSASSQVEKQDWMKALRRAIDAHQKMVSTLKTPPTGGWAVLFFPRVACKGLCCSSLVWRVRGLCCSSLVWREGGCAVLPRVAWACLFFPRVACKGAVLFFLVWRVRAVLFFPRVTCKGCAVPRVACKGAVLFFPRVTCKGLCCSSCGVAVLFFPRVACKGAVLFLPRVAFGAVLFFPRVACKGAVLFFPRVALGLCCSSPRVACKGAVLFFPRVACKGAVLFFLVWRGAVLFFPRVACKGAVLFLPRVACKGAVLFFPRVACKGLCCSSLVWRGAVLFFPRVACKGAVLFLPRVACKGLWLFFPRVACKGAVLFLPRDACKGAVLFFPRVAWAVLFFPRVACKGAVLFLPRVAWAVLFLPRVACKGAVLFLPRVACKGAVLFFPRVAWAVLFFPRVTCKGLCCSSLVWRVRGCAVLPSCGVGCAVLPSCGV